MVTVGLNLLFVSLCRITQISRFWAESNQAGAGTHDAGKGGDGCRRASKHLESAPGAHFFFPGPW